MASQEVGQLAWCVAKEGLQPPASCQHLGSKDPLHFHSEAFLTRWLFSQPRGAITPSVLLIVGWQEAKPCADVVRAARTGNVEKLRPDSKRPELRAATPGNISANNVAIAEIIILTADDAQEKRAQKLIRKGGYDQDVPVKVVTGMTNLEADLLARFAVPRALAHNEESIPAAAPSTQQAPGASRFPSERSGGSFGDAPRGLSPISFSCAQRAVPPRADMFESCAEEPVMTHACSAPAASAGRVVRRRWASISSSRDRTPSLCDDLWNSEAASVSSSRVRTPSPWARMPGGSLARPSMACTSWAHAARGPRSLCSSRARTPSPDYMWPGFDVSALAPLGPRAPRVSQALASGVACAPSGWPATASAEEPAPTGKLGCSCDPDKGCPASKPTFMFYALSV